VQNRRRVVYYAILLLLILGELLGERNYIIIIFPEYDRLLERYSTLYTSLSVRVSRIGAKLVCLSVTSKQAKVALECCHAV